MDTQTSSSIEKQKPGPKAKPKPDYEDLERRIHNLEQLLIRVCHNSGTSHGIIKKAGLEPYQPTKNDMNKFRDKVA